MQVLSAPMFTAAEFNGTGVLPVGLRPQRAIQWVLLCMMLTLWVPCLQAQDGEPWLFFYNSTTGIGASGYITNGGIFTQTQALTNAELPKGITHVINSNHGLLLYRQTDGLMCTGQFSHDGNLTLTGSQCAYPFTMGWTHIVSLGENIVFYNSTSGVAKIATISPAGLFRWISNFSIKPLAVGYSTLANTRNGLVFHNAASGVLAVGQFDLLGRFRQTYFNSYKPSTVGLTKIFSFKNNWLLFYGINGSLRALVDHAGKLQIGGLEGYEYNRKNLLNIGPWTLGYDPIEYNDTGIFANFPKGGMSFMNSVGSFNPLLQLYPFSANWSDLVVTGDYVLFYAITTGDYAVGRFDPTVISILDPTSPPKGYAGYLMDLKFVQTQSGIARFSTGWTHIVSTD